MSEVKSYYKNFLTMLSGNMMSQLIPFIIAPILTRLFTPDDFAVYANYLAVVSMIGIVAAGRLELAIPISKEKKEAQEIVFTGLMITLALSILSLAYPLFPDFFGKMYDAPDIQNFFWLIPFGVVSYGLLGIATNWVLRLKKYNGIAVGKVTQSIINNGLAACLGYLGWGVSGLIYGWLAGQFIAVLMLVVFVDRKVSTKNYSITTIKSTVKKYRDFPLINSMHAFTDVFATQFLLFWIISDSFGLTELGLFVMMHKYVRAPVTLVTSSVSSIFYTEMGAAINEGRSLIPILKKTITTSVLFSIPFVLIIVLFAPQLFAWYFGSEWEMGGVYAQRILPILILLFINSPISSIPVLMNEQRKAFVFAVILYIVTLSSLVITTTLGWAFGDALIVYSLLMAGFQLIYLYWFYILIKRHHVSTR